MVSIEDFSKQNLWESKNKDENKDEEENKDKEEDENIEGMDVGGKKSNRNRKDNRHSSSVILTQHICSNTF